jgi:uncharacterized protein YdgA (DUF945 family)
MKKIITIAVLLGIAGVAASPFLIGTQIESVTQEQAKLSNQYLAQSVKNNPYLSKGSFTLESYEKTYTSATAKSLLKLETIIPQKNGEPLVLEIPLTSEITHGPYLGDSGFGLAKVISRPDITAMELPEFIKADTFMVEDIISFTGQVNETFTMAAIKHDDGQGTFELGGIKADVETSLDNRLSFTGDIAVADIKVSTAQSDESFHLKPFNITMQGKGDSAATSGDYQFEALDIKGEGGKGFTLAIQKLSANGTYKASENTDLSLGKQEMLLTNVEINDPEMLPDPVILPEFKIATLLEEGSPQTLNLQANYSAVLSPELMAVFQSPVNVKSVDLGIGMTSLPVAALQAYMELAQNLSAPQQPEAGMAAMQEKLPGLIRMVINSAMAGSVTLLAETDEGKLDADLKVNFIADETFSDDDAMALMMSAGEDPAALLALLAGKGSLHLDKSVTDKAGITPMVEMMAAEFVTLEGEAFKSELLIQDGEILVNGQALPLFAGAEIDGDEPQPLSADDLSDEQKAELKALLEGDSGNSLSDEEKAILKSLMDGAEAGSD